MAGEPSSRAAGLGGQPGDARRSVRSREPSAASSESNSTISYLLNPFDGDDLPRFGEPPAGDARAAVEGLGIPTARAKEQPGFHGRREDDRLLVGQVNESKDDSGEAVALPVMSAALRCRTTSGDLAASRGYYSTALTAIDTEFPIDRRVSTALTEPEPNDCEARLSDGAGDQELTVMEPNLSAGAVPEIDMLRLDRLDSSGAHGERRSNAFGVMAPHTSRPRHDRGQTSIDLPVRHDGGSEPARSTPDRVEYGHRGSPGTRRSRRGRANRQRRHAGGANRRGDAQGRRQPGRSMDARSSTNGSWADWDLDEQQQLWLQPPDAAAMAGAGMTTEIAPAAAGPGLGPLETERLVHRWLEEGRSFRLAAPRKPSAGGDGPGTPTLMAEGGKEAAAAGAAHLSSSEDPPPPAANGTAAGPQHQAWRLEAGSKQLLPISTFGQSPPPAPAAGKADVPAKEPQPRPAARQRRSTIARAMLDSTLHKTLFFLSLLGNLLLLAGVLVRHRSSGKGAALHAALGNLLLSSIITTEVFLIGLYTAMCRLPHSLPLRARFWAAKLCYNLGGIHSGCGCAAAAWLTGHLAQGPAQEAGSAVEVSVLVIEVATLVLLYLIILSSYHTFRAKHHDLFERLHRLGGWSSLLLLWAATGLEVSRSQRSAWSPMLVLVALLTFLIALPWAFVRRVRIQHSSPSKHCIMLTMPDAPPAGTFGRISRNPLWEWHPFATATVAPRGSTASASPDAADLPQKKPPAVPAEKAGPSSCSGASANTCGVMAPSLYASDSTLGSRPVTAAEAGDVEAGRPDAAAEQSADAASDNQVELKVKIDKPSEKEEPHPGAHGTIGSGAPEAEVDSEENSEDMTSSVSDAQIADAKVDDNKAAGAAVEAKEVAPPHVAKTHPQHHMVISRAGDWTSRLIDDPPDYIWVRRIRCPGFMYTSRMFRKVLYVATGAGIAPVWPFVANPVTDGFVLWITRSPLATFGPVIADAVRAYPQLWLHDTTRDGRPDVLQLTREAYHRFGAEAVFLISNEPVTWHVVNNLHAEGICVFGAIWDS